MRYFTRALYQFLQQPQRVRNELLESELCDQSDNLWDEATTLYSEYLHANKESFSQEVRDLSALDFHDNRIGGVSYMLDRLSLSFWWCNKTKGLWTAYSTLLDFSGAVYSLGHETAVDGDVVCTEIYQYPTGSYEFNVLTVREELTVHFQSVVVTQRKQENLDAPPRFWYLR
ncbi:MAG: hypothetical protein N2C14_18190 [Planctomycetales bacterium]